jgi:hypothetical protein
MRNRNNLTAKNRAELMSKIVKIFKQDPSMAIQKIRYINGTDHNLLVIVEPWANQYRIRPTQQVVITIDGGDVDDCLEIEHTPAGLILYGWTGSMVTLTENGVELPSGPQE